MTARTANFADRLGYLIIYGTCYVVGLLPWWFLYYVVVEVIYFFLYVLARYRVKVVRGNLARSFPEKTKKELRLIERRFYRNLSEYFVDTIDLAGMPQKTLLKRMVTSGCDRLKRELDGRNWIVMLGHFGSWELRNAYALYPEMSVLVSAYRPVKSKPLDMYYHKIRHRFAKLRSVPMNDLMRYYIKHKDGIDGYSVNLALIADQNPRQNGQSAWMPFLGQPTVFFQGGERISRKFNMPVYYVALRKVKRGHYEQWFEPVWDGKSPTADGDITRRFAALLEAEIRECPELWMWSHRRWKKHPSGEELKEYNELYGTKYTGEEWQ